MRTEYIILIVLSVLVASYEVYALLDNKPGDTISEVVWYLSKRPLLPFLVGIVCGHFFWQRPLP